ncbi:hypothetical protein [Azorhizobium doebereinerae]|uniref:hypothetical protein n=1 Tax=Azorhizobium doebereinerae TaxID=281091 RepID=UPI00042517DD|nr:hypothetical protein [Azorhizobium doebereinerae]
MVSEPESLVLVYLHRLDEKRDRVVDDVSDLKVRMTAIEERFATVELALAGVNRRIDRVEACHDRIERRLDLVELPH